MIKKLRLLAALLVLSFSTISCSSSGSDDDDLGGSDGDSLTTQCGVVLNGTLRNPVGINEGEAAIVRSVVSALFVIVEVSSGNKLVKLHGIRESGSPGNSLQAQNLLATVVGAPLQYYRAVDKCTAPGPGPAGTTAEVGQLVTLSGTSMSELLLSNEAVDVETANQCQSNKLEACYAALLDAAAD